MQLPNGIGVIAVHVKTYGDLRPLSNDERRAQWAAQFFALGHHYREREPMTPTNHPHRIEEWK